MSLTDIPLTTLDGRATTFAEYAAGPVLVVNVASRCGFAPQYAALEQLQRDYGDRGLTVLGFPSNQFAQELGSADAIAEYCSATWGVTFPMMEKTKVNGKNAHPLFAALHDVADAKGRSGKVRWNFEKFLIAPDGGMARFRSPVEPDSPAVIAAIESALLKPDPA